MVRPAKRQKGLNKPIPIIKTNKLIKWVIFSHFCLIVSDLVTNCFQTKQNLKYGDMIDEEKIDCRFRIFGSEGVGYKRISNQFSSSSTISKFYRWFEKRYQIEIFEIRCAGTGEIKVMNDFICEMMELGVFFILFETLPNLTKVCD